MTVAKSVEEAQRRLGNLKLTRADVQGDLDKLNAERRDLLRYCLDNGVSQAELARWEGVTDWAISQAVKRGEVSATGAT